MVEEREENKVKLSKLKKNHVLSLSVYKKITEENADIYGLR